MFIIDFRNKNVSEYRFSVIGNSNVDKVNLVSHFIQYASNTSIYLKVESFDGNYVDKIAIASENISVDEDALVCKWTMGAVSTQCKKLRLQLQFEQGETIIAQTGVVNLTLADTINVDELIPVIYPQVLKELQDQIDTLKVKSFALASMSYSNDVLHLYFENAMHEIVSNVQVAIPTSDKMLFIEGANLKTLAELYTLTQGKVFMTNDMEIVKVAQSGSSYDVNIWDSNAYGYKSNQSGSKILGDVEYNYTAYVKQRTNADIVYGNDHSGNQTTFDVDYGSNFGGKVVRRDSNDQIYVPLTPTQNGHATSKKYVDDKISDILRRHYEKVDITEYPTLNDFLASEGVEGTFYLYPIDTTEAPDFNSGYYCYIWENSAWTYLGTTEIDLSGYVDLTSQQTISGNKTFSGNTTIGSDYSIYEDGTGMFALAYHGTDYIIKANQTNFFTDKNLLPISTNAKDLGSSTYTWKDIYLSGKILFGNNANIRKDASNRINIQYANIDKIIVGGSYVDFGANIAPTTNNTYSIGSSASKWKDLYLAGNLSNGTQSFTIEHAYNLLNNVVDNTSGTLSFDKELVESISADKTYLFPAVSMGTNPECKATITNSGNSTITLTFDNVKHCLCNDDNAVITSTENQLTHIWTTTITIGAGVSYEISIVNQNMVAINFEAQ